MSVDMLYQEAWIRMFVTGDNKGDYEWTWNISRWPSPALAPTVDGRRRDLVVELPVEQGRRKGGDDCRRRSSHYLVSRARWEVYWGKGTQVRISRPELKIRDVVELCVLAQEEDEELHRPQQPRHQLAHCSPREGREYMVSSTYISVLREYELFYLNNGEKPLSIVTSVLGLSYLDV